MTSTRSAAALGLPAFLNSVSTPELEGSGLRLHASPVITMRWPTGDRGYVLVALTPGDDPDEQAALVRLPLAQAEALAKACAAFNRIMDEHAARDDAPAAPQRAEPRAQALVTAVAQVAILAGLLPAVLARCFGLL